LLERGSILRCPERIPNKGKEEVSPKEERLPEKKEDEKKRGEGNLTPKGYRGALTL